MLRAVANTGRAVGAAYRGRGDHGHVRRVTNGGSGYQPPGCWLWPMRSSGSATGRGDRHPHRAGGLHGRRQLERACPRLVATVRAHGVHPILAAPLVERVMVRGSITLVSTAAAASGITDLLLVLATDL